MTDQYLGEIRIFGFNPAPSGWATCTDGQTLAISQFSALFAELGTNFGGNWHEEHLPGAQLPGQYRRPQGQGQGLSPYSVGRANRHADGDAAENQLPSHGHTINTLSATRSSQSVHAPTNQAYLGTSTPDGIYNSRVAPTQPFAPEAIGPGPSAGGSSPPENRQPYLVLIFCIAMQGAFPARN